MKEMIKILEIHPSFLNSDWNSIPELTLNY